MMSLFFFFFSSRRRHTRSLCDWSSDVCSSDLRVYFFDLLGSALGSVLVIPAVSRLGAEQVEEVDAAGGEAAIGQETAQDRSEERRVGEEGKSRWCPDH